MLTILLFKLTYTILTDTSEFALSTARLYLGPASTARSTLYAVPRQYNPESRMGAVLPLGVLGSNTGGAPSGNSITVVTTLDTALQRPQALAAAATTWMASADASATSGASPWHSVPSTVTLRDPAASLLLSTLAETLNTPGIGATGRCIRTVIVPVGAGSDWLALHAALHTVSRMVAIAPPCARPLVREKPPLHVYGENHTANTTSRRHWEMRGGAAMQNGAVWPRT